MRGVQLLFVLLGAALATVGPFIGVMLQARGFTPTAIGLVAAVSALGFTIAVPVWGHLADVTLGRARALQVAAIGAAASMAAFGLPLPAILLGSSVVLWNVFQSALQPLADALAIGLLRDPARQYGRIRLLTSVTYGVVVVGVGFLYDRTGYVAAPILWALACLILAAGLVAVREPRRTRLVIEHRGGSARMALAVQPRLPAVLFTFGLLFFAILGSYTFMNLRIVQLGGSPSALAIASGLAAVAEVPGLMLAAPLARRIGLRGLFVGSALLYSVAVLSWAFIESPEALIASRIVSGPAFGGLSMACVLTINVLLPVRLQATGQGLYQTIAFGVGSMLGNAAGGAAYELVGPAGLFAGAAAAGMAAAVVGLLVLPRAGESRASDPDEPDAAVAATAIP